MHGHLNVKVRLSILRYYFFFFFYNFLDIKSRNILEQEILGLYIYRNTIIFQANVMLEFGDNDADTLIFRISKI